MIYKLVLLCAINGSLLIAMEEDQQQLQAQLADALLLEEMPSGNFCHNVATETQVANLVRRGVRATPAHMSSAIYNGHSVAILDLLVQAGGSFRLPRPAFSGDHATLYEPPVIYFAARGASALEKLDLALTHDADPNERMVYSDNRQMPPQDYTALHWIARFRPRGALRIAQLLIIKHEADPTLKDCQGNLPWQLADPGPLREYLIPKVKA